MFPELACFAYARNLLRGKAREYEYDSFGLHILKFLKINMANSPMLYVQVKFDFEARCKHGQFDLGRGEDKYTAFSVPVSYDSITFFDEAPLIVESYLHSLFDDLTDRDQIFGDNGDMQYVLR